MEWATVESMRPARSTFVTVVAWIFIALDGMTAFILTIQNIVVNTIFPLAQLHAGMAKAEATGHLPPYFSAVFEHLRPLLLACLLLALIKLVAAIGLLRRVNWARLLFITLLALGIAWSFAGIVLQHFLLSSMLEMPRPPNAPQDFETAFRGMMIVIRVFSAMMAIGFAVLYAWMIRKLVSPAIAAEFARN